MSIAIVALIVLAILALVAIPVIAAVVGRSATDDDPNKTGDPEDDPNVEPRREPPLERNEEGKDPADRR